MDNVNDLSEVSAENFELRLSQIIDILRQGTIIIMHHRGNAIIKNEFDDLKYQKLTDIASKFNMARNDDDNDPYFILRHLKNNDYELKLYHGGLTKIKLSLDELYRFIDVFNNYFIEPSPSGDEEDNVVIAPFTGEKPAQSFNIKG